MGNVLVSTKFSTHVGNNLLPAGRFFTITVELSDRELAHSARAKHARDFVNFRKKFMHRACAARPPGFEGTTTGSDHDRTLRLLVLSHAIENQNSDFVMQ